MPAIRISLRRLENDHGRRSIVGSSARHAFLDAWQRNACYAARHSRCDGRLFGEHYVVRHGRLFSRIFRRFDACSVLDQARRTRSRFRGARINDFRHIHFVRGFSFPPYLGAFESYYWILLFGRLCSCGKLAERQLDEPNQGEKPCRFISWFKCSALYPLRLC